MPRKSRALPPSPFRRFNSSPEVIRLVVLMYVRFPLSLRNAPLETVMPSINLVASAISAMLDPDLIVLGGRLPAALADRIIERIAFANPERRGFHRPPPCIAASAINGDAAAIGAATLPLRAAFFDSDYIDTSDAGTSAD